MTTRESRAVSALKALMEGRGLGCSIAPYHAHQITTCSCPPLRFSPSRLGRSRNRSSPGSTPLNPGFPESFALCGHSLCNPGTDVGKSLGAQLPLPGCFCSLNPRPSCDLSRSHSGPAGCTDLLPTASTRPQRLPAQNWLLFWGYSRMSSDRGVFAREWAVIHRLRTSFGRREGYFP